MGGWGDGEMGRWGDGVMGGQFAIRNSQFLPSGDASRTQLPITHSQFAITNYQFPTLKLAIFHGAIASSEFTRGRSNKSTDFVTVKPMSLVS